MTRRPAAVKSGAPRGTPSSLEFLGHLRWLDGKPLLDTIEPYRRAIFANALDSGAYTLTLAGRGRFGDRSTATTATSLRTIRIKPVMTCHWRASSLSAIPT